MNESGAERGRFQAERKGQLSDKQGGRCGQEWSLSWESGSSSSFRESHVRCHRSTIKGKSKRREAASYSGGGSESEGTSGEFSSEGEARYPVAILGLPLDLELPTVSHVASPTCLNANNVI